MATAKKLPSGNWRVLVYTGTSSGKRQYKSFTAPTKKQAEYDAALFGVRRKRVDTALTVGEAIDRYIDSKAAVLSPKTISEYRAIRKRGNTKFMSLKLDKITDEQIQTEISEFSTTHSPKTTRNVFALFKSAARLFRTDFAPVVTLPQPERTEVAIPTDDAVKQLLGASTGDLKIAIMLAAMLGLRRSEICGLNWSDIKENTVNISKAVVMDEGRKWVTKTTKTTLSTRTLEMPDVLSAYLAPLRGKGAVISLSPDAVTHDFIELCKSLGISIHFHSLRHYYASTLLEMGVPDMYAMRHMGHSSTSMLKAVYQHIKDKRQQEIDRQIDDKLTSLFG